MSNALLLHCVKSVQIWSFFWAIFSCMRTEYRKIRTTKNSIFGHFSRSVRSNPAFHFWYSAKLSELINFFSIVCILPWNHSMYPPWNYQKTKSRIDIGRRSLNTFLDNVNRKTFSGFDMDYRSEKIFCR